MRAKKILTFALLNSKNVQLYRWFQAVWAEKKINTRKLEYPKSKRIFGFRVARNRLWYSGQVWKFGKFELNDFPTQSSSSNSIFVEQGFFLLTGFKITRNFGFTSAWLLKFDSRSSNRVDWLELEYPICLTWVRELKLDSSPSIPVCTIWKPSNPSLGFCPSQVLQVHNFGFLQHYSFFSNNQLF